MDGVRGSARLASLCALLFLFLPLLAGFEVASADEQTLTVGLLSEPTTLHPLAATSNETKDIIWQLFLKLLEEEGDFLGFRPRLARSWSFSEDSLSITFHLRDDVRWTDGYPVTAADVRFTWELHADSVVAWSGRQDKLAIRNVEVIDDHTVRFDFKERYPYQLMDANDGVILPRHLLAGVPRDKLRTHPFGRAPVGNGPYKLGEWKPGRYIELVANPDYFEAGKPHVPRVVFEFVPDEVTLMLKLRKGEIDLLEAIPPDQIGDGGMLFGKVRIYKYPSRKMTYIAWNLRRPLFSDAEVRRAMTMAIDRKEIIQTIWGGFAMECTSPISPILWAYDPTIEPLPFDPNAARAKLEQLGWDDTDGDGVIDKDGVPFSFELITNHSNQLRVDVATMTEAYLKKIGVRVKIRTLETNTCVEKLLSADFDACVFGWANATKPDVSNQWHSKSVRPNGFNIASYRNPEVDALIDRAKTELDMDEARRLWGEVQRRVYYDQPFTFIAVPYAVNGLNDRFCNVHPNAISFFYNLRDWRVGSDCR